MVRGTTFTSSLELESSSQQQRHNNSEQSTQSTNLLPNNETCHCNLSYTVEEHFENFHQKKTWCKSVCVCGATNKHEKNFRFMHEVFPCFKSEIRNNGICSFYNNLEKMENYFVFAEKKFEKVTKQKTIRNKNSDALSISCD